MFNTDKPIGRTNDDLLNRATFSKELANAILSYDDKDNFAISLCGEWGCGKTSILNMVVQEINTLSKNMEDDRKPIIIKFNPWNYSDKNQLITEFFKEISIVFNKKDNNKKLKKLGESIENYSAIMDFTKFIPTVGQYIALAKPLIKAFGKNIKDISNKSNSIEKQKNIVVNGLKELKQKIIVIIDDIDRLNNEQIRMIFQLVNSVAGFPNMIYLLSFDKAVVVRALSEEQNCNGEEYLAKIIQVPFDVPMAKKELIHKIFFNELDKIVGNIPSDMLDIEHWNGVFRDCISYFIGNIRDVNRIINAYKLKYSLMNTETNWVDLLCITVLQICAPEIYNWIKDNFNNWVGALSETDGISYSEQKEFKNEYLTVFEKVYSKNPEFMLGALQALFPKFCWKTGGYSSYNKTAEQLRYLQRISSPEHSILYFHLSLNDVAITRNEVIQSICDYNEDQMRLYIKILKGTERLQPYLQELNCCIDKIPQERINMFFDLFIGLQLGPAIEEGNNLIRPNTSYDCHRCIWSILNRMTELEITNLFKEKIAISTSDEFGILLQYIVQIEQAYDRIGGGYGYSYRVITEESLAEIEKECSKKLKYFSTNNKLLDSSKFMYIMWMWQYLSKEDFDNYISLQLRDAINIPPILNYMSTVWSSGNETGWNFNKDNIEEYMEIDEIYKELQKLKGTKAFNDLNLSQKQVGIAYTVWYESNSKDYHEISRSRIDKLISEWEPE